MRADEKHLHVLFVSGARTASKAKHLQRPLKSLPDVSRRQYARASEYASGVRRER